MEITLSEICERVGGRLQGDPDAVIRGAAPFDTATAEDITFAAGAAFLKKIDQTAAGAVFVPEAFDRGKTNLIRVKNPQLAFTIVLQHLYQPPRPAEGIDSRAVVGENTVFGDQVTLCPNCVVGNGVTIGSRVILYPGVVLGDRVSIGNDVVIYPNVSVLERCIIGSRVIIHAGTVIGSDGFGFASDGRVYYKIPQTGIVQIDDDVEIGANNTIDRAAFDKTWIKRGVKTDNLVHIAHNVTIGEDTIIVAQVGIAGSVTVGRHVTFAGQSAVAGHLSIGDNAIIGPRAGIAKSIPAGQVMSGAPEMPHRQWLRVQRIVPMLPEMKKKISELEKRLASLEGKD